MADGSSIPEQASEKRSKRTNEETFDAQLEWLIVMGDAAMGERGTLAGTIAQLEHGGPFTGVPSTDLYTDQQVGWSSTVVGLVEKHRVLSTAWALMSDKGRGHALLWYSAPRAQFRSDEGFGAKDRCPTVEEIQKLGAPEPSKPTGFHIRKGTEAQLGRAAALAFQLCPDPAALLMACQDPNKGKHGRTIARDLKAAREAAVELHREWRDCLARVGKPRKPTERRALLPEFVPGEAEQ
jgi:hypothetical protein